MKIYMDVLAFVQDRIKYMGDNHFANISIKFRICLLNVYCLFSLTGYLRLFLVYNFELINIGEWMAFSSTMLVYDRVGPFRAMFFYTFTEWPLGLPSVRRFAAWISAGPLIDNILFEGRIYFDFGMHEHWFNGILTPETNMNMLYLNNCLKDSLRPG